MDGDVEERGWISWATGGYFDSVEVESVDITKFHNELEDEPIIGNFELGTSGLRRSGGYVDEEWLRQLRGDRALRIYREMRDNDPTVGAVLYAIESLILQAPWQVEAPGPDPTPEQIEARDFVRGALFTDRDQTWQTTLSEILSMIAFGWSFFEVVYKRRTGGEESRFDDGKIGWKKFAVRSQATRERWIFDDVGDVVAMVQVDNSVGTHATIPLAKALLFTFRTHLNSPEGRSGLRNAYRPWYFVKKLQNIEAVGLERDLAGLPVIKVPMEVASADDATLLGQMRAKMFGIVKNIRIDAQMGVVMPAAENQDGKTGYDLELLSTGGKRGGDIALAIDRNRKDIAMTMLAQFLHLGMDKTGSFALASNATALFSVALGATMDRITSVINRHAIPKIMRLNSIPQENWPVLVHGDVESRDLAKLADFVNKLVTVGAMSPDDLEASLREAANLPPRETPQATVDTPAAPVVEQPAPDAPPPQTNGNSQPEEQA